MIKRLATSTGSERIRAQLLAKTKESLPKTLPSPQQGILRNLCGSLRSSSDSLEQTLPESRLQQLSCTAQDLEVLPIITLLIVRFLLFFKMVTECIPLFETRELSSVPAV